MRNTSDTTGDLGASFARRGLGGETFAFSITNAPDLNGIFSGAHGTFGEEEKAPAAGLARIFSM